MKTYIDNLEPTAADYAAAERFANSLPDAAPGVIVEPSTKFNNPNDFENYDVDDSEWLSSLKDKA